MSSKLKSMFTRQTSQPSRSRAENSEESSSIMQEMKTIPPEFRKMRRDVNSSLSNVQDSNTNENTVLIRRKTRTRRHNTSLGAIEDLLQCPICKDRLQSPRMMPCQHTFCQKCLEKRLHESKNHEGLTCALCNLPVSDRAPELLPTNLYIESLLRVMDNTDGEGWLRLVTNNPVVSFAPLPDKTSESESISPRLPEFPGRCIKCSISCNKDNRCKHCKQVFCSACWTVHVDEIKNHFDKIVELLETTSSRFDNSIDEFRLKVDEIKDSIEKDIQARMAELIHEREARLKSLICRVERGEESAKEVKRRLSKVLEEVNAQKSGLYDALSDNNAKKISFLKRKIKAATAKLFKHLNHPENSSVSCEGILLQKYTQNL